MAATLRHRGPDDDGAWATEDGSVALGFRRLAILDLSPAGHQPMTSHSGRYTIAFNGEVFNHHALRDDLTPWGYPFRGHSDTEVLLAAFERWGVRAAVPRFVGMFAIAVWDAEDRTLTLVRDRIGIKPLYVYGASGYCAFASELKALAAGPQFSRVIDRAAFTDYLRYLYVPGPRTIYSNARKLMPGHLLELKDPSLGVPESCAYWSLDAAAFGPRFMDISDAELIDDAERRITRAVALRMEADVPLGAFLSSGLDSSLVVATMQAQSARPITTFCVAFDQAQHDESRGARAIAAHLGTDHVQVDVSAADAISLVPELPSMFDEPFADPSQLPTYLMCRLARRKLVVALTGDGGDELFAGYNRYEYGERLLPSLTRWPLRLREAVGALMTAVGPGPAVGLARVEQWLRGRSGHWRLPEEKYGKFAKLLGMRDIVDGYLRLVSATMSPARFVRGARDEARMAEQAVLADERLSLLERMLLRDQRAYLPDDLLAKVDRTSMAASLEVRVPLLDHQLVEWSWGLDRRFKIRNGQRKWILRQLLSRRLPAHLIGHGKIGFTAPIADWLRGPLREWVGDLLSPSRLSRFELLEEGAVGMVWRQFQRHPAHGDATLVWALAMGAAWEQEWLSAGRARS